MTEQDVIREFAALGFVHRIENEGKHWIFSHPDMHLGFWPSSGKWYAFGKHFKATPAQVISAYKAGRFKMPPGSADSQAKCRSCGADIWWVETSGGKNMPIDRDGNSHFATCPDADRHRRAKQ